MTTSKIPFNFFILVFRTLTRQWRGLAKPSVKTQN